jgi:hypothetical protein
MPVGRGAPGSGGTAGSAGTGGTNGLLPDGGLANLLENPDFEDGVSRWVQVGTCVLRTVTEPPAQSGTRSLEIANRTYEWEGPGYSVLNLLEDGQTYDAGVWVRLAEGEVPLQLTLKRLCEGDPANGQFLPLAAVAANTEWQYLSAIVTKPPCDSSQTILFVEVPFSSQSDPNKTATFYIDNTSLTLSNP